MDKEINIDQIRKNLTSEKATVERELEMVGRKNKDVPGDWEAVPPQAESEAPADKNTAADMVESFEEAYATEGELEQRLAQIDKALQNIENGTYGTCKICGQKIENERLNANPAAMTCIAHLNE